MMVTPRKTVRAPYVLPPEIEVVIAEEIVAPHCKRGRMTSPYPDTAVEATTDAIIPARLREPDQHTIPLLMARLIHHKDRIHEIHDHLKEIPLERFESMEHELEILHEQEVDTLQVTLGVALERITDLEIRIEDTEI
ncbi:hypothetical protein Tco_0164913 [Tanacetum coccineum]